MWYIGIDLHQRTFAMVAIDEDGKVRFRHSSSTSSRDLQAAVSGLSGRKQVVLEESTLAGWAYRELQRHARVVVADPWYNRSIGKDEKLDDEKAALKLANLLRMGEIRPVHHTADLSRQAFKELVLMYHRACGDQTRAKNRLKAKFSQHGVRCAGQGVYQALSRERWREQLPSPEVQRLADVVWADVDHFAEQCTRLRRELRQYSRSINVIGRFRAVPGIGLVRAATFYALVDAPERFANKRKLWSYCGIGLAQRKSGTHAEPEHLVSRYSPRLKAVAKGAAVSAIAVGANRFAEQYARLLGRRLEPSLARLTVARSIIATLYAMWLRGTQYDPQHAVPWPKEARAHSSSSASATHPRTNG